MKMITSVTLDLDVAIKLQKEKNRSALIQSLLVKHYKNAIPELDKVIEEAKEVISEAITQKTSIEREEDMERSVKSTADQYGYDEWKRKSNERVKELFGIDIGRPITEPEFKEWEERHKTGLGAKQFVDILKARDVSNS